MDIKGCIALVTGANRGLGKSFVDALLAQGAAKIYAAARTLPQGAVSQGETSQGGDSGQRPNPEQALAAEQGRDPRITPVKLDVTSSEDISAVAARCNDVTILINNAGVMLMTPMLKESSDTALRREISMVGTLVRSNAQLSRAPRHRCRRRHPRARLSPQTPP
jgi:NAD(P)-dependent dehydrogenase (short-subunit alcohol dehydrogenase family)